MSHPNHKRHIASLKRIEGQVSGIIKMVESEKYCIDILNQVKAVKNSISSVERKILVTHLSACVKSSLEGSKDYEKKVNELLKVLKR